MSGWKWFLSTLALLAIWGCSHGGAATVREDPGSWAVVRETFDEPEDSVCVNGGTLSSRIWVLVGQGQFAEAEVLIAEGAAAGLLSKPQSARMLEEIAKLTTRLGDLPARLQRAPDFPSQLKEYTLYQIEQMAKRGAFSIATKAQLKMAEKLIRQAERLMQRY